MTINILFICDYCFSLLLLICTIYLYMITVSGLSSSSANMYNIFIC